MSETPPVLQPSKTEKLLQSSFALGIASIVCGITALPAIIQSIRALILLRKEANKTAFRKVIFSLIFSTCTLGFIVFSVGLALNAAQGFAKQLNCVNNMKELGLAVKIYASDNYDRFPSSNWCDVILTNGIGTSEYFTNISRCFRCPNAPKNQRCGYAMNSQLMGIKDTDQIAEDTVMLFESDAGWNAVGGPEILAKRHLGLNVTLVDSSVQEIQPKDISKLRWNPYTNAPAK